MRWRLPSWRPAASAPRIFAFYHPGGTLGRRLLLKVSDLMHTGDQLPRVKPETLMSEALLEISRKGLGMTAITDAEGGSSAFSRTVTFDARWTRDWTSTRPVLKKS